MHNHTSSDVKRPGECPSCDGLQGIMHCPGCGSPEAVGVQVRDVYDGVLYWSCGSCHATWHRFPKGSVMRQLASEYVDGSC